MTFFDFEEKVKQKKHTALNAEPGFVFALAGLLGAPL